MGVSLMAFDFNKVADGRAIASITDPSVLFDALPNKAEGYGYLRAVQKTVLDSWSNVEMNATSSSRRTPEAAKRSRVY